MKPANHSQEERSTPMFLDAEEEAADERLRATLESYDHGDEGTAAEVVEQRLLARATARKNIKG